MQLQTEITNALDVLNKGGLILFPTDTVWGIGCDATNEAAVQKVYDLKKHTDPKAMLCLVANTRMLERFVYEVPDPAYDLIEASNKPLTIIYDRPINIAPSLIGSDNTLAFRVVQNELCQKLIAKFKRPLVFTSANTHGQQAPRSFKNIETEIKNQTDHTISPEMKLVINIPSTVIKLSNNGEVRIIRK
ncbi:threonylcarbamoyl-AMP synthase [Robertkochia marina]|uniref:L-threonylcarbamoyladenylate synthase n=1 Tax=Robertkochia marina TaxID=1227945 RepID=A0A4S3LX44_9FLAO|nr:L-threonylcarbamoyladenylate synthase [Robertkochia marina]THD65756.1 threonylcarbamoyl-AMP synthase [Robertkochia marina]TRZ46559.1 threonylcarbamoyl-AMP synthase [Robertkochia marina]